jgi:hypothetical protein
MAICHGVSTVLPPIFHIRVSLFWCPSLQETNNVQVNLEPPSYLQLIFTYRKLQCHFYVSWINCSFRKIILQIQSPSQTMLKINKTINKSHSPHLICGWVQLKITWGLLLLDLWETPTVIQTTRLLRRHSHTDNQTPSVAQSYRRPDSFNHSQAEKQTPWSTSQRVRVTLQLTVSQSV